MMMMMVMMTTMEGSPGGLLVLLPQHESRRHHAPELHEGAGGDEDADGMPNRPSIVIVGASSRDSLFLFAFPVLSFALVSFAP